MKRLVIILLLAAPLSSIYGQSTFGLSDTFTSVPSGVVDLLVQSATRYETVLDTLYQYEKVSHYSSSDSLSPYYKDVDSSVVVWALYFNDAKVIVRRIWVKGYGGSMNHEVIYIPKPFYRKDITPYPIDIHFPESLGIGIYFESLDDMAPRYQKSIIQGEGVSKKIGEYDYLTYKNIEGHFWIDVPKVFPNIVYLH